MSYNYNPMAGTAKRLLAKYGLDAKSTTEVASNDFDPSNPLGLHSKERTGKAIRDKFSYSYVSRFNNLIQEQDVMLLCSADLELEEGSVVSFSGQDWLVIKPNPIKPADVVLAYEAHVRSV